MKNTPEGNKSRMNICLYCRNRAIEDAQKPKDVEIYTALKELK